MSEENEIEYEGMADPKFKPKQKQKSSKSVLVGFSAMINQLADRIERNKEFNSMKKQRDKLVRSLDQLKSLLDQKETKK